MEYKVTTRPDSGFSAKAAGLEMPHASDREGELLLRLWAGSPGTFSQRLPGGDFVGKSILMANLT